MQVNVRIASALLLLPMIMYIVVFVISLPIYLAVPCGTVCDALGTWFFILIFAAPLPLVYVGFIQRETKAELTVTAPVTNSEGVLEFTTEKGKMKRMKFTTAEMSDFETIKFKVGALKILSTRFDSDSQAIAELAQAYRNGEVISSESLELRLRIFQFSRVIPYVVIFTLSLLYFDTTIWIYSDHSSDYKPYGETYGLSESLSIFNFEYTHKPYDQATGFYYYGARYYDPSISRFITEDSISNSNILDPLSLNRYSYVENNPESRIDPSGNVYVTGGYHWYDPSTSQATTPPPPAPPPPVTTTPPQTPSPPPAPPNHYYYNYRTMHMMETQSNFESQAGNIGETQSNSLQYAHNPVGWFLNDFFFQPEHIAQLAGIAIDLLALFFPTVRIWGKQLTKATVGFFSSWAFAGYDAGKLAVSIMRGNTAGFVKGVASTLADFFNYFWSTLNLWDRLNFGATSFAVTVLGDAATAGQYQAYADVVGGIKLATDAGIYVYDAISEWQAYESS
jgi:RHS repeat-associated protein